MRHACLRKRRVAARSTRMFPGRSGARRSPLHAVARIAIAAGLFLGLASAGCDSHEDEPRPWRRPRVTVMAAVRREVTDWDEFTGRFASTERVELRTRVGGHLDSIHFLGGQVVRRGDLLFRIDPRPFAAAATEGEARLTSARSQLTLAQQEYDRARNLRQYRAASDENVEQRVQALDAARAQVVQLEAALRGPAGLGVTEVPRPSRAGSGATRSAWATLSRGRRERGHPAATLSTMDPIDFVFETIRPPGSAISAWRKRRPALLARGGDNPVQLAWPTKPGSRTLARRLRRQRGQRRHRHRPPARPPRQPARPVFPAASRGSPWSPAPLPGLLVPTRRWRPTSPPRALRPGARATRSRRARSGSVP